MFESDKSDSSSIKSLAIGSIPGGGVAITATWPELVWFSLSYSLEKYMSMINYGVISEYVSFGGTYL